jgi:hypothetical protein
VRKRSCARIAELVRGEIQESERLIFDTKRNGAVVANVAVVKK